MARAPDRRRGRPPRVDLAAILDAAEQVGLDQLTATAVAERLQVSEATVRHHSVSAEQLYALACARVLDRLDITIEAATWRQYVAELCDRLAALVADHPGIESYLVYGPYAAATMDLFDRITVEIQIRATDMSVETAWLLGSRAVIITTALLAVRSSRYPPGVEPAERRQALFDWTLEAYLTGAEVLIANDRVPQLQPTSHQTWARLADDADAM